MAATLSVILIDYLFIPPRYSLEIKSLQDSLILGLYFIIALVTGNLTARLARQKKFLQQREDQTSALYRMSGQISQATSLSELQQIAVKNICKVLNADAAILMPDKSNRLVESVSANNFKLDEKELSVADWAFKNNQMAGRFTETLSTSKAQYIPLATPGSVVGVVAIHPPQGKTFTVDQESLLQTFISHLALAIERELLHEASHEALIITESERLYATLLDSISYELRSPLTSIDTAIQSLEANHAMLSGATTITPDVLNDDDDALATIKNASTRLNRLVSNLLNMTRLEAGHLKLNLEPTDVGKLVSASIETVQEDLSNHEVIVDVDPRIPLIPMDAALMQQVLVNLLENAATYTPKGTRVRVIAKMDENRLVLSVLDRGPGLPAQDINRVFDKFYRVPSDVSGGNGLGLSICRGIVEAHGGSITAENRPTRGGARFNIQLPVEEVVPANLPSH
jgi:two-component system sensor histidine kinase KdpD